MDFMESPFPFDQADELFPLPSLPFFDVDTVPQLPFIISHSDSNHRTQTQTDLSPNPKNGKRRRKSPTATATATTAITTSDDVDNDNPNETKKKKIIHRDVERQRRQEMSTLYATLRSLLPVEYLKGKRSICDHMHETVKYIRHMQGKIQKLSDKRDEQKKRLSGDKNPNAAVETLHTSKRDSVAVRPRWGGVQVVLDTATQHRLPVSNVIQALIGEGLEIVSCISTKINDRFLHTIDSEIVDVGGRSIDLSELQMKLTNLEYFPLD